MTLINYIELQQIHDDCLMCVAETAKHIPFAIKRVYFMVDSDPKLPRGFHTHKKLVQAFFCIRGSMRMVLDDGLHKEEFVLDNPAKGIILHPMIWHEMHDITKDTIMLVLASDYYREEDYIRDYTEFTNLIQHKT